MPESAQTYKNHSKIVPLFHYVVFPALTANMAFAVIAAIKSTSTPTVVAALTAVALVFLAFFARIFALKVQDRVIRLEMRMRLKELLPASLHPRIAEFTVKQLVAMRFASDAELPELAETVLRDRITDQKAIKLMVKNWTPDDYRA